MLFIEAIKAVTPSDAPWHALAHDLCLCRRLVFYLHAYVGTHAANITHSIKFGRQRAPRGPRGTADPQRTTARHSGPWRGTATHCPSSRDPKTASAAPAILFWKPFLPKGCPAMWNLKTETPHSWRFQFGVDWPVKFYF